MTSSLIIMPYFVYCITNLINNKSYVGSTESIKNRFRMHRWLAKHCENKDAQALHIDMYKYGVENFIFQVIEQFDTEKEMYETEFWYMQYLQTIIPNGYNLTTGRGQTGYFNPSYSVEIKRQIIKDYVERGMTIRYLEKQYKLSREIIRKIVPKDLRSKRQHQSKITTDDELSIIYKYNNGDRAEDIGLFLSISPGKVYKILKKHNVKLRHDHHRVLK